MTASDDLPVRIGADRSIAELLARPGDFDIDRRDPVEELRLPTGVPLRPIAGCGAGGAQSGWTRAGNRCATTSSGCSAVNTWTAAER